MVKGVKMIKQYGEGTAIICDFCGVKLQFDGNKSGNEAQIALKSQGWVEQGEKVKCAGCQQSRADIPKLIEQLTEIQERLEVELSVERELLRLDNTASGFGNSINNTHYLVEITRYISTALFNLRRMK
jgi:hypothetical protein